MLNVYKRALIYAMEKCLDLLKDVDSKENTSSLLKLTVTNKGLKNSLKNKIIPFLNEIKKVIYHTTCVDTLNNLLLIIYSTVPPTKLFKLKYFDGLNDKFLLIEENKFFEKFNEFMLSVNKSIFGFKINKLIYMNGYENGFAYFSKDIKICFHEKIFRISYQSIKEAILKEKELILNFSENNMILQVNNLKYTELLNLFKEKNISVNIEITNLCENLTNIKTKNKVSLHKSMESDKTSTTLTISSPLKDIYIEHGIKGKDKTSTTEIEISQSKNNSSDAITKKIENKKINENEKNISEENQNKNSISYSQKPSTESEDERKINKKNKVLQNENSISCSQKSTIENEMKINKKSKVLQNKNTFYKPETTLNTEKLIDQINDLSSASVKMIKNKKDLRTKKLEKKEKSEKNSELLKEISFLGDSFLKVKKKKLKKENKRGIKRKIYKILKEKIKYKIKIIEEIKKLIIVKEKEKAKRIFKKLIDF